MNQTSTHPVNVENDPPPEVPPQESTPVKNFLDELNQLLTGNVNQDQAIRNTYYKQRDELIRAIRFEVVKDPTLAIDTTDILGEDVKQMPLSDIQAIHDNIMIQKSVKNRGYFPLQILKLMEYFINIFSKGQYTIASSFHDEELKEEVDSVISAFIPYIPDPLRLSFKLGSHLKPKVLAPPKEITPKSNPANHDNNGSKEVSGGV